MGKGFLTQRTLVLAAFGIAAAVLAFYLISREAVAPTTESGAPPSSTPTPAASGNGAPGETPTPASGSSGRTAGGAYRNNASGIAFGYSTRYFISSEIDSTEEKTVRLNKTADRSQIGPGLPNRASFIQESALLNRAELPIETLMRTWGETLIGSRFTQDANCSDATVAGEKGRRCSIYAGVERGGYREAIFVKHGAWTFRFEAGSLTSNDVVHSDLDGLIRSVTWLY